jgi:hypothetical protein
MRPIRILAAAILTAIGCTHANAADPAAVAPPLVRDALRWQCRQQFDAYFTVECDADRSRTAQLPPPDANIVPVAESTGFDPRPVALRGHAVATREPWRVPLFALPFSAGDVEYLLRAVLCGYHPDCAVDYANPGLPRVIAVTPRRRRL